MMDALFCAELNDIKVVRNVLKSISFKEFAVVRIMEEGLKVTIEEMKSVQTSAYIPTNMFTRYELRSNGDNIQTPTFKISLKVFTECLSIFGDDGTPSLKIVYRGYSSPLSLVLSHSEENVTADCEINTLEADDLADLSLADECNLNNIVIKASQFVTILSELETTSRVFELTTSPEAPYLQMKAIGDKGENQIAVLKQSDCVMLFRCKTACTAQYSFNYIKQLIKVLTFADQVSISTSDNGLLGLQLIIQTECERQMFVEYYVTALELVE